MLYPLVGLVEDRSSLHSPSEDHPLVLEPAPRQRRRIPSQATMRPRVRHRLQKAMREPFRELLEEFLLQDLQLGLSAREEEVVAMLRGVSMRISLHSYPLEEDRIWPNQAHLYSQMYPRCPHHPISHINSNISTDFHHLLRRLLWRLEDRVGRCQHQGEHHSHKARVPASRYLHMARRRARHPLLLSPFPKMNHPRHRLERTTPGLHLLLRHSNREVECSFLGLLAPLKVRTALPLLSHKAALSSRAVKVQGRPQPQSPFKSLQ